ncbi:MAG: phosphoribosylanthranilate isomerase [Oscillospiraceae bacterium]|nr:phosphoribosylanthranilate isomerase [Oscillospiraceae bacterium]
MVKIKICGLTDEKEAEYLNANKVDFAGFVLFYPQSRRNISTEKAKKIINKLENSIKTVAVTVSPTREQIKEISRSGFDYIQIHGDTEKDLIETAGIPVLRAFNVKNINEFDMYANTSNIAGYVFDANEPGSGKTFDWSSVKKFSAGDRMVILAGGLNADNVEEACRYLRPDAVDVSSGVENDGGTGKDKAKIDRFVRNARNA